MKHLKSYLLRILIFFRIVDAHDLTLSLTNIGMIIALYKVYATPALSMVDIGTLFCMLSQYSLKRYINQGVINQATDILNKITPEKEES
jgi:hypothetical protein